MQMQLGWQRNVLNVNWRRNKWIHRISSQWRNHIYYLWSNLMGRREAFPDLETQWRVTSRYSWMTGNCGQDSGPSPTRWSSPRMEGNYNFIASIRRNNSWKSLQSLHGFLRHQNIIYISYICLRFKLFYKYNIYLKKINFKKFRPLENRPNLNLFLQPRLDNFNNDC